jgi:LDH2 family malate/lactate/ureidoglycolate dehydrogenase
MQGSDGIHSAEDLLRLARDVLEEAGAPPAHAGTVAESLVESNLRGHDSHGVRRLVPYVGFIRAGRLDPAAEPEVIRRHGATLVVDGNDGFGQVAAGRAVEELTAVVREAGAGAAVVKRANHVGRIGEWVEALADAGLVALAFCSAEPIVAPYGGRERRLGTNPLAWAAPRRPPAPALVMDWSTATMPEGKVAVARARGEEVPDGVLVDASGEPSRDPEALYAGGALLPFGAHKGSGLSVMIQLVGGTLAGAGVFGEQGEAANGTVLLALDVAAFMPREDFDEEAEAFCAALTGTKPAKGFDAVLVPGEIERRTRVRRAREGIPIPAATWSELEALKGGARA